MSQHLARKDVRGKTIIVKMRLADFTTLTRRTTLNSYTDAEEEILAAGWELLSRELTEGRSFRLLGVGMSGFGEESPGPTQLELPLEPC